MTEVTHEQAEAMEKDAPQEEQVQVGAEITIQVMTDGTLNLNLNEDYSELQAQQIEEIVRSVADRLQEQRIAAQALELFKSKLSF